MKILLAGGTGLIGTTLIRQASQINFSIITVGRRATGLVKDEIIDDFSCVRTLPRAEVAICSLGTTMGKAGSKEAFRNVDYTAVLNFAIAAKRAGATRFLVVTAVGANPESSFFYSRIKGEVERELIEVGFKRLDVIRPGLLIGSRTERRLVECVLQKLSPIIDPLLFGSMRRYSGIGSDQVAKALLVLCLQKQQGVFYHENQTLSDLAENGSLQK